MITRFIKLLKLYSARCGIRKEYLVSVFLILLLTVQKVK